MIPDLKKGIGKKLAAIEHKQLNQEPREPENSNKCSQGARNRFTRGHGREVNQRQRAKSNNDQHDKHPINPE